MIPRLAWTLLGARRYPGWRPRLARIRRLQRLDPASFASWQEEAVARHLRWAAVRIPWWRERIRPWHHLEDLPILSRAAVQRHAERLRDPARPLGRLEEQASGGSTGEPVVLWQDQAYKSWDHATEIHVMASWGLEPWCRGAFVWGSDRDLSTLPPRDRLWIRLLDRRLYDAFRMGEADLPAIAGDMERFQPRYVQGYASALELLARWLLAHRPGHRIRPRVIRSSAETLSAKAREAIEGAFHAPVRDFYGSRESASIAAECSRGSLHVQAHARVVEIVDEAGRVLGPGEPGRLLVTDLTNRAFGLIRYETGDVAAWGDEAPCACGCPYPRLERVYGRTSDFITTPGGERVHGEWFTHLFYGRRDVTRFQVRQTALESLHVRTVGPAREEDLGDVLHAIRERLGPEVVVTWEAVEDLEVGPSGKHRFTISDVSWRPADEGEAP